jgi:hypothetical protein
MLLSLKIAVEPAVPAEPGNWANENGGNKKTKYNGSRKRVGVIDAFIYQKCFTKNEMNLLPNCKENGKMLLHFS